jgi:ABC-type uncharacterized transport system permease subunit
MLYNLHTAPLHLTASESVPATLERAILVLRVVLIRMMMSFNFLRNADARVEAIFHHGGAVLRR